MPHGCRTRRRSCAPAHAPSFGRRCWTQWTRPLIPGDRIRPAWVRALANHQALVILRSCPRRSAPPRRAEGRAGDGRGMERRRSRHARPGRHHLRARQRAGSGRAGVHLLTHPTRSSLAMATRSAAHGYLRRDRAAVAAIMYRWAGGYRTGGTPSTAFLRRGDSRCLRTPAAPVRVDR